MKIPTIAKGDIPPDHVAPDALQGIPRQQTNPGRWSGEGWDDYVKHLAGNGVHVNEGKAIKSLYCTDAGAVAHGLPHGIVNAVSAKEIAEILKAAQKHRVPVTVKGGGLTTEGESIAFGGLQLDMRGMSRVVAIDKENMTIRTEAGIYWHSLAEALRKYGLDYLSAPLNLTASVGGTIGVGGVDINSPQLGCSADQVISMQVVTPKGRIVECSEKKNRELFERVLFGYGQFGVITEATLRIRKFRPITIHYFYYSSLRKAMEDMQMLVRSDAADYIGILTMLDRVVNILVAFDSDERERLFFTNYKRYLRGFGELGFSIKTGAYYALHPWKYQEAAFLLDRKKNMMPDFTPPYHMVDGKIYDRVVVYGKAIWKYWGDKQMVIPDLATSEEKFIEAILRGNQVCKKFFPHYTLYCVAIKLFGDLPRYEMSCFPPDAKDFGYGCEFEPMLEGKTYSRDYLQSFKNEIYDIGVELGTSYYRFGGVMKGYIRRVFGDELVDKHLALKRKADPAMILNPDVIF